ncbi:GRB10-interacting GYF protein 2-like isoform X9 [Salvelinus fontinalis]|uniref:GRB10-interacting GYF protein 2-like isoform X9 n=1 Tax=Salvelinus fontinalis TaxID=8038 RepID=UPI002486A1A7|nr:GRB10-interacting GYF protein 2-like isoform X9 [Salvelinus fontinalis]
MAETQTLNFGPEWLRALSGGGHGGGSSSCVATSPPLSPAMPKYKLADYRYGREEMLALYVKEREIPVDLHDKDFLPILQEEPLPPLALVAFTEEEQRNFSMSVNSAAVLRLMGRGGGPVGPGAPRGRSTSRGRGRGRGDGGFYQRSFDDVEGGFGRGGREMHRSQSWEERGDRRFEKPGRKEPEVAPTHFLMNHIRANYEEVGTGVGGLPVRKHDFTRSESENWRTSREEVNGEDGEEGGWRLAGTLACALRRDSERWCPPSPDGTRSAGWREAHPGEQPRQRRLPFDAREDERGYRHPPSASGSLEEDGGGSLPEWCLEDAEEETGTFDSSGAFLSLKKAPKEPILEEAELDFRPLEECDEGLEEDGHPRENKDTDEEARREPDRKQDVGRAIEEAAHSPPEPLPPSQPDRVEDPEGPLEKPLERPPAPEHRPEANKVPLHTPMSNTMLDSLPTPHTVAHTLTVSAPSYTIQMQQKPLEVPVAMPAPLPFSASLMPKCTSIMAPNNMATSTGLMAPIGRPTAMPPHHTMDEDEGLKHFEQEAEKMVAYLQDGDDRLAAKSSATKPAGLPLTHEAALKWFYKDPQGEIQGPFSNPEMTEWFQAGYFTMTLLVKRGCDEVFQPLGEIIKMWGRVPFAPGPAPPPLLGDAGDQERLKRQQELTALNLYQLQQLQYQYLLRQQYAQALAQQKAQALSSAPHQQQQQQQQQINLLLQQYQALKMRTSESLLPPVTRSMSVPESQGSVWEMQNTSQASCTSNIQQPTPSAWEGSSVWDLPIDSMAQAPTIEQMQNLEKNKAAKLELERGEAELGAKREEEEHKRLEEEQLARQKQEEALKRQRKQQQEEAQRQQKEEEEERHAQEEALRRLEEGRRREEEEEEERKQREEFLRKQEEEHRKQEELEALRRHEEEKRQQEEAAAVALVRQQQEEAKRREQELARQRQQQQEALRRLQQQQQLAQMKLPSSSKWGQQSAVTAAAISQSQNALSLAEIQKVEEERERQAREEQRRQQAEHLKLLQQQALQEARNPQAKLSGWGSVAKQPATTKSLLEIQREEAQQVKQRKEQGGGGQQPSHPTVTQQNRAQNKATTALSPSVWGSVATSGGAPNWGGDSSIWGDSTNSNMGFWDEDVAQAPPPARKPNAQKNNKGNANLSSRANKKVEEEEKLLKLFQGVNKRQQDAFMQWCEKTLHTLNTANNLDVPTFASFLKEVDSPYEVHDYVRAYLGDTSEAKEFAKQFLERRAKQNANQQKAPPAPQNQQPTLKQQQQDSMWGVSGTGSPSLYQSNHTSLQQQARFETVTSGKKKKKQKMVRADPSLLGFSVNAASERLNMGEIETVEDF